MRSNAAVGVAAILWLAFLCAPSTIGAQGEQGTGVLAPIVRTEHSGGGVVRIVYDLSGTAGRVFAVSVEASSDGGRTFAIRPVAVTGDVGPGVSNRGEKTIVWDSSKDVDD